MRLLGIALLSLACATTRSVSQVPLSEDETRFAESIVGGGDVRLDPGNIELSHAHVDAATINGVHDGNTWSVDLRQVSAITALDRPGGVFHGAALGAGIGALAGAVIAIPFAVGSHCSGVACEGGGSVLYFPVLAGAGLVIGVLLGAAIGVSKPVEHRLEFPGLPSIEGAKPMVVSDSPRSPTESPTIVLQPAPKAPQETPASGVHWFAGGALGALVDRSGGGFGGGFAGSLDLSLARDRWALHAGAIFATPTQYVKDASVTAVYATALYASRDLASSPYLGLGAGYLAEAGGADSVRESKGGAAAVAELGWSFGRNRTILHIDLAVTIAVPLYEVPGSGPAAFPLATLMLRVML